MSPYWISGALVVIGFVLLGVVLLRAYRAVRTLVVVRGAVKTVIGHELGMLRARRAALGVARRDTIRVGRRLVHEHEGRP